MAKINDDFTSCNLIIPAINILVAEVVSVPLHNSSPKIKLSAVELFRIVRNSDISTANVLRPLNKLSLPNIRVKIDLYGL